MILTRQELLDTFIRGGVPSWVVASLAHSIQGVRFGTVSREWVSASWNAWLDSLRLNAPELVTLRDLGGGRSRLVPNYVLNGFNCRGQGLLAYAHGMTGYALQAARSRIALEHDALAWGFLHYTARPRSDNLNRDGRHENLWFVDHAGTFQSFEQGDGEENEMTPEEVASITFLYAQ